MIPSGTVVANKIVTGILVANKVARRNVVANTIHMRDEVARIQSYTGSARIQTRNMGAGQIRTRQQTYQETRLELHELEGRAAVRELLHWAQMCNLDMAHLGCFSHARSYTICERRVHKAMPPFQ
jgi:hypothetical protein